MIFGTVGMHDRQFDRLVQALDAWAASTDERVVIQTGRSRQLPVHAEAFSYAPHAQMAALAETARAVVTHAGAGSVLAALDAGARVLLMPRLRRHGEHWDDHQLHFALSLQQMNHVEVVHDVQELVYRLDAMPASVSQPTSQLSHLNGYLKERLRSLVERR